MKNEEFEDTLALITRHSSLITFLVGLIVLLAFAAWWHLDMSGNAYHGPRWMGLWDNPNTYGMLMSAGTVLAIGILAAKERKEHKDVFNCFGRNVLCSLRSFEAVKSAVGNLQSAMLLVAAGMMFVGLVMSYSRGAWLATAIGLLYLAWCYGKLKWRYVAISAGCVALSAGLLWSHTPDTAPWYVKRADLGRPSAQHRASAWRAGLEIMRDHPLGVGWNNAVSIYENNFSPPEDGAAAITTNDYMMIGTELGIPAWLCFVVYVGFCLRSPRNVSVKSLASNPGTGIAAGASALVEQGRDQDTLADAVKSPAEPCKSLPAEPAAIMRWDEARHLRVICRAGALVFVVAFWFDGGLFKLPTAALFWVLLELGAEPSPLRVRPTPFSITRGL